MPCAVYIIISSREALCRRKSFAVRLFVHFVLVLFARNMGRDSADVLSYRTRPCRGVGQSLTPSRAVLAFSVQIEGQGQCRQIEQCVIFRIVRLQPVDCINAPICAK